jgi:hypothetical protein
MILAIALCTTPAESAAKGFNLRETNSQIKNLNRQIEQNAYWPGPHVVSPLYRLKNESGGYLTGSKSGLLTLNDKDTGVNRDNQLWVLGTSEWDSVLANLGTGRVLTREKEIGKVVTLKATTRNQEFSRRQDWSLQGASKGRDLDRLGILNSTPKQNHLGLVNSGWTNTPGTAFQLRNDERDSHSATVFLTTCPASLFSISISITLEPRYTKGKQEFLTVCNTPDQQGSKSNWILEPADTRQLGKLTIDIIREIKQSTGTDSNTEWLFEGIDAVLTSAATYGASAGVGAISKRILAAPAKAALKQALKQSAKKAAALAAKQSARAAAEKAIKAAAKKTLKQLAKESAKIGLTKSASAGSKHFLKSVTKRMVAEAVAKKAAKKLGKYVMRRAGFPGVKTNVLKTLGSTDTTLSGKMFNVLYQGSCDNRDDLQIKVNDNLIWPYGGGDSKSKQVPCNTRWERPNVEIIFPLSTGVTLGLMEYDSGSNNDSLGSVYIRTDDLRQLAIVEDAMIPHIGEKSLYEVSFSIQPYTADNQFSEGKRVNSVDKWITERDNLTEQRLQAMTGEWRLGYYKDNKKDRNVTWRNTLLHGTRGVAESDHNEDYHFLDAGFQMTPEGSGEWSTEDFERWERPQKRINAIKDPDTEPEIRHNTLSKFNCESKNPKTRECIPGKKVALKPAPIRQLEPNERRRYKNHLFFAPHDTNTVILGRSKTEGVEEYYNNGEELIWQDRPPTLLREDPAEVLEYFQLRGLKTQEHVLTYLRDFPPNEIDKRIKLVGRKFIDRSYPATYYDGMAKMGNVWMEKIEEGSSAPKETEETIENAKQALIGYWQVELDSAFKTEDSLFNNARLDGKPVDWRSAYFLFTDDGLVLSWNDDWSRIKDVKNPGRVFGAWKYLGDRRFEIYLTGRLPNVKRRITPTNEVAKAIAAHRDPRVAVSDIIEEYAYGPEATSELFEPLPKKATPTRSLAKYYGAPEKEPSPNETTEMLGKRFTIHLGEGTPHAKGFYIVRTNFDRFTNTHNTNYIRARFPEKREGKIVSPFKWNNFIKPAGPESLLIDLGYIRQSQNKSAPAGEEASESTQALAAKADALQNASNLKKLQDAEAAYRKFAYAKNRDRLRKIHSDTRCDSATAAKIMTNFVGNWSIIKHKFDGKTLDYFSRKRGWNFSNNGKLSGQIDGKDWTASWSAVSGCRATAKLDSTTAEYLGIPTDIKVELAFKPNGDKVLHIVGPEQSIPEYNDFLRVSGSQEVDKSLYQYSYDQILPSVDQLANECAIEEHLENTKQGDPAVGSNAVLRKNVVLDALKKIGAIDASIRARGEKVVISLDAKNPKDKSHKKLVYSPNLGFYRVNFSTTNAKRVDTRNFVIQGRYIVRDNIQAIRGDRIAVVDLDNHNCIGVMKITHPVTDYRQVFKFPPPARMYIDPELRWTPKQVVASNRYKSNHKNRKEFKEHSLEAYHQKIKHAEQVYKIKTKLAKAGAARNMFFEKDAIIEATLNFEPNLTPFQIANGCADRPTLKSGRPQRISARVKRKIFNSGESDFSVYNIGEDGDYSEPTGAVNVSSGKSSVLNAETGKKYTVLDNQHKCVATFGVDYEELPIFIFGDGSQSIEDPEHLTATQIRNGCLSITELSFSPSDYYASATFSNRELNSRPKSMCTTEGGISRTISNTSSTDMSIHWVNYNGSYGDSPPVMILKPGQSRIMRDYRSSVYVATGADNSCVAVFDLLLTDQHSGGLTIGDGSVPITDKAKDLFFAPIDKPSEPLTPTQIDNGCGLYGKIASTPKDWNISVENCGGSEWEEQRARLKEINPEPFFRAIGTNYGKPLSLHWLSFNGTPTNGEHWREPGTIRGVASREHLGIHEEFEAGRREGDPGDVYMLSESDGTCVAIIKGSEISNSKYSYPWNKMENWEALDDYGIEKTTKGNRVFRDRATQIKDVTEATKRTENEAVLAKNITSLQQLQSPDECGAGTGNYFHEQVLPGRNAKWNTQYGGRNHQKYESIELDKSLSGRWEVGVFDAKGNKVQINSTNPSMWTTKRNYIPNLSWKEDHGQSGVFNTTANGDKLESPVIWNIVRKKKTQFNEADEAFVVNGRIVYPDIWHHYLEGKTPDGEKFSARLQADGCELTVGEEIDTPGITPNDPIKIIVEEDGAKAFYTSFEACYEEGWRMIDGDLALNGGILNKFEHEGRGIRTYAVAGCESIDSAKRGAGEKVLFPRVWARKIANEAPTTKDLSVEVAEDDTVYINLQGSASDADRNELEFRIVNEPSNGKLDGLIYKPDHNFHGSDSFTYVAVDEQGEESAPASVSITVLSVNDHPIANPRFEQSGDEADRLIETDEDTPVEITLEGSDVDGDELSYRVVSAPDAGTLSGTPPHLVYTPSPDTNTGPDVYRAHRLSYVVNDGTVDSGWTTLHITVNAVNDAPLAEDVSITTDEDRLVEVDLDGSDVDRQSLAFVLATEPSAGTLQVGYSNPYQVGDSLGQVFYLPTENFNGEDTFTYVTNDGVVDSEPATVTITVNSVNDVPVPHDLTITVDEDATTPIELVGSDADGDLLTFLIPDQPSNGTLTAEGDAFSYTPNPDYVGSDSFTFVAHDGTWISPQSDAATVSITVVSTNDAPVAEDSETRINEDSTGGDYIAFPVSDLDGDALIYRLTSAPANGSFEIAIGEEFTAQSLSYTPNENFHGTDSVTFIANDGTVDSNEATVTIIIEPVNDAPLVEDQLLNINEDTAVEITLIASDVEDDTLIFYVNEFDVIGGVLSGDAPNLLYTPEENFSGTENFTFYANDGLDDSLSATVTIVVEPVADTPVAENGEVWVDEGSSVLITLYASDVDNSELFYSILSGPNNGSVNGTGPDLEYTPNLGFNGTDSFTFIAQNTELSSTEAIVSITVNSVNDIPIAEDQLLTMPGETDLEVIMTATDADGDSLTYQVYNDPQNGYITENDSEDGSVLIYRPNSGFIGEDSFTFHASDNNYGQSQTATISITVTDSGNGCSARYETVSTESDEHVQISFMNEGPTNVNIYWLSPDGHEGDYAGSSRPVDTVGHGQSIDISAYRGYKFVILDDDYRCYGIAEATDEGNGASFGFINVWVTDVKSNDYTDGDNSDEQSNDDDGDSFNDEEPNGSSILTPAQIAKGCAEHGQIASEDKGSSANMHVTNESSEWLSVYWVNFNGVDTDYADEGNHSSIDAIAPGCRVDFAGTRGYVFSILDNFGQCVGLLKARESRNGIVLGENGPSTCE